MRDHLLKIWPEYFEAKLKGLKPWEYRFNDRKFQVGDKLCLVEWEPKNGNDGIFTGRQMVVEITYIHEIPGGNGFVIMSDTSANLTTPI